MTLQQFRGTFQGGFDLLFVRQHRLEQVADSFEPVQDIPDGELVPGPSLCELPATLAASKPERPGKRAEHRERQWFLRSRFADSQNKLCPFFAATPCVAW